jgi:O-antigen/teichoic acid export membrane protein
MSASPGLISRLQASWRSPARRNLALTVGAGLLVQLMLVVTGPFLARLLGPAGRGDLAALMLWPIVLVQLGGLGIPAALTYYISRGARREETMRRALTFAGSQAVVLIALQLVVVLLVFDDRGPDVRDGALLTIAAVPGLLAQEYGLAVLQSRSDLRRFNVLRLLPTTLFMIAVIVLFLTSAGLVAVTLSWVAATTAVGAATFTLAFARRAALPAGEEPPPRGRELLSFGLRGILSANSATDIIRPEQIALVLFLPSRALGLYVVALAITNLPYFIAKAVGLVAFPAVARSPEPVAARRVAWRYLWIIAAVAGGIVVVLLLTASLVIPLFFGEEFRESVDLSYILLGGAFFTAIRRVGAECMRGRGQPGAGTTAEIAAIAWLLAGLAILIPTVGLTGVAIALASSQVASLTLLAAIAARRGELHGADATATLRHGIAEVAPALARYRR